jgi:hypothetical protein
MEIIEVNKQEYGEEIPSPYFIFGSAPFNNLNKNKSEIVYYLLFRDNKFRLGIIGGIKNNEFHSPFSAPYGGFSYISQNISIEHIDEAIEALLNWAMRKKISSITITLPPPIYNNSFITKQVNSLWRGDFEFKNIDLNHSFNLDYFDNYNQHINQKGRRNLKLAMKAGLRFFKCKNNKDKKLAYDIIHKNREKKGIPLRMTWKQITDTANIVLADFFCAYNDKQIPVASAIVFHINPSVVQLIYWGDIPDFYKLRPMNFLSFKIFEYYKSQGKKIVDLGPSSVNSSPNYGLSKFKKSIGCNISLKYTLTKIFQ